MNNVLLGLQKLEEGGRRRRLNRWSSLSFQLQGRLLQLVAHRVRHVLSFGETCGVLEVR